MLVPEDAARFAERLKAMVDTPPAHRALIRGVEAGLDRSTPYLALEYAPGESLDVLLRQSGRWALARAVPVLREIAAAIDASWAAGTGHGALHPRDIFVAFAPTDVRVTGFGIGAALEAVGAKVPVRRPYSAPERGEGSWDIRSDVYSLGVVAFEMLSGQRPVGPDDEASALAADLPADARAAVRRMLGVAMSEAPGDRYETATAFVNALGGVVAEVTEEEPEVTERRSGGDRRRPGIGTVSTVPELVLVDDDAFPDEQDSTEVTEERPEVTERRKTEAAEPALLLAKPDLSELKPEPISPAGRPPSSSSIPTIPPSPPFSSAPLPPAPPPLPPFHEVPLSKPESPRGPAVGSFLNAEVEPESTSSFPWAAVAAVFIAGLVLAGVVMYQWGWSRGHSAAARETAQATSTPSPTPLTTTSESPSPSATPTPIVAAAPKPTNAKPEGPPPVGRLVIQSVPDGALVTIDGKRNGETPVTVQLPLGKHDIQIARSGYLSATRRADLTKKSPAQTLRVTLQRGPAEGSTAKKPTTGGADVDSNPRGARVSIDGKFVGITPLRVADLSVGQHKVLFEKPGHKAVTSTVNIVGGEVARVTVSLVMGEALDMRSGGAGR